ncbi:HD domain-containing protein [Bifidobacterium favimelis]|uniref:HD domain-containing protein n=1 Tax=Bifidobacterium favimelis TaxID=3122979 RepID=A0ABU8ZQI4_9BIFI
MIPNIEQAEALHRKYAPSKAAYDLIHTHCVIISIIARDTVRRANARYRQAQGQTVAQEELLAGAEDKGQPTGTVPDHLLDEDLTVVGALLHDMGTYLILKDDGSDGSTVTFQGERYIEHGILGYRLLLDEGVDESVAQFARNHTGVGLTRAQVEKEGLPLPPDDYIPVNQEQEVVMYADKFHSKHTPPIFVSEATAAKRNARYGQANLDRWKVLVERYGVPELGGLAGRYSMQVV